MLIRLAKGNRIIGESDLAIVKHELFKYLNRANHSFENALILGFVGF